jgi:pilus assembly protein CpaE
MAERILIVDDDRDSLTLIGLMLQRQGYQTATAQSGSQALQMAEAQPPDLILLDVMMPDMDGFEVCRRLRSVPRLAQIPVIMFTAKTLVEDKVAGFEAGADDYLTKPTHPQELNARVKAMLSRARSQAQTADARRADIVAVMGVRGGLGTTTTALNLAAALMQAGQDVVFAEFRPGAATAGLQLGLERFRSLTNLMGRPIMDLHPVTVENELIRHESGLRLLLASHQPLETPMSLSPEYADTLLKALASLAGVVVVDIGAGLHEANRRVLSAADKIIVCLEPERISVNLAQALLAELNRVGIPAEHILPVLIQRAASAVALPTAAVETALQRRVFQVITPAAKLADEAIERGTPMVLAQPDSATARQFRELASGLAIAERELLRSPNGATP